MCGIVGTLNLTQDHVIEQSQLHKMLGAIRHRGPDQFGIYIFQDDSSGVGLGNARLSIIDLAGGQQPVGNEDGSIWIVFNGEIFNYIELQADLKRLGHKLATSSDTEVIIHLYEQYGRDCVNYLNGQFVFALWDERARRLFVARDRLGIRPLYYTERDGALIFASEMKALLTDPRVSAEIDSVTLDQLFTYWSPIRPRTILKDVWTLPPGHTLTVSHGSGIVIEPYWQPTFPEQGQRHLFDLSLDEAAGELRRLLIDATKLRLRADVPVGAYLSGGLDSSAITALIRSYTSNRLETFSIAFADENFDESVYQRQMADLLGTKHHVITCTHKEIGESFPEVIWHTEVPLMRTSPVPLFLLSRLVQNSGFKVVLTGEGADEFLTGYNIFKETKIREFWSRKPDSTWRASLLNQLYPYIGLLASGGDAYLAKFFGQGLYEVDDPFYSHAIRWRNTSRGKRFFSERLRSRLASRVTPLPVPPDAFFRWDSLSRAQYLEITIFMQEYLLSAQGDRVAMAHSVEGRFPFLDHRVVEFCNHLPPRFKLRGLDEKHLLKRAVRDLLPDAIWRRPKRPYRAPIHRSFFPEGRPLEWVSESMSQRNVADAGLFDPQAVRNLEKKIVRMRILGETDDMALAGILSAQLVHQRFIREFDPSPALDAHDDIKAVIKVYASQTLSAEQKAMPG